jgi:hypothetical protein
VLSRLDQYLKISIQKRGITIIENTYSAFDTEYELSDARKNLNTLLSVQTAVQTRTLVKVPLYTDYDISYVHPLTSEVSSIYKNKLDNKNPYRYNFTRPLYHSNKSRKPAPREIVILNNSLKVLIKSVRDLLYPSLYAANAALINGLQSLPGANHFYDTKHDQAVFLLPLTEQESSIVYTQEVTDPFNFPYLLQLCKSKTSGLRDNYILVQNLFASLGLTTAKRTPLIFYDNSVTKPRTRTKIILSYEGNRLELSLTIIKNQYLIAHYNAADLANLTDFKELQSKISIVNKSFVTLGKPLKIGSTNVYIRDTMLISPSGAGNLESLGKLYKSSNGEQLDKIKIKGDKAHMGEYLRDHREEFTLYANRDAEITLQHALAMEEFNMSINQIGIPLTLSSMGRRYVLKAFAEFDRFMPYQISGECKMGNANEVQTPKGLHATGAVGAHLSYYIANYKGGRNESFMYGVDDSTRFYDYDLTSAYTTGMADLPLPDYHRGRLLKQSEFKDLLGRKGE